MNLKKGLLKKSRLYIVLDKKVLKSGERIFHSANEIKNLNAGIIQYRDKGAKKEDALKNAYILRKLLSHTDTLFIINDYLDIAKLVDSDGIHLGQSDSSVYITRRILGKNKVIGVSCHNLSQAMKAQKNGADYVSIGPIFATSTKPEYKAIGLKLIKAIKEKIKIPFFAIGGINQDNISRVLSQGVKRVAICKAVCRAKNIPLAINRLKNSLSQ